MNTPLNKPFAILFLLSTCFFVSANAQRDRSTNREQRGNSYSNRNGGNNSNRGGNDNRTSNDNVRQRSFDRSSDFNRGNNNNKKCEFSHGYPAKFLNPSNYTAASDKPNLQTHGECNSIERQ